MKGLDRGGGQGWEAGAPVEWWEHWAVLRMWRSDRSFRRMTLVLVLVGLVVGLSLVPWIPGHPLPDGQRTRMCGWDRLRALRHDLAMGEAGRAGFRADPVAWAWRVGLDPGDPRPIRAYMECLAQSREPGLGELTNALAWGNRLWRLAGTNASDVERVFRIGRNAGCEEWLLEQADDWIPWLGPAERESWAATAADHERWDIVRRLLAEGGIAAEGTVGRAWTARWGSGAAAQQARAALENVAAAGGPESANAGRLLLLVWVGFGRLEEAMGSLERLRSRGEVRCLDAVRVGQLGLRNGRAVQMARWLDGWTPGPSEAREVPRWAGLVRELWGVGRASAVWRGGWKRWRRAEWVGPMVEVMREARDWGGLLEVSAELRTRPEGGVEAEALGWILEALAREATGREREAALAWEAARTRPVPDSPSALAWVKRLSAWGRLREVPDWLETAESAGAQDLDYWRLRVRHARLAGQPEDLERAAAGLRRIAPWDPEGVNAAATAWLWKPEAAHRPLELLAEARLRAGLNVEGRALEVMALGRVGRTNESAARWSVLRNEAVGEFERTMVCLAAFEMHAREGWNEAALEDYRQIETKHLMPAQIRWLEQEYLRLSGSRRGGKRSVPGEEL